MKRIIAIRGATTILENTKDEIVKETLNLITSIMQANSSLILNGSIISVIISSTADIDEYYPAAAITNSGILKNVPLFSALEPNVKNSLPLCIRVLMTIQTASDLAPNHIYLNKASSLKTNTASDN